MNSQTLEEDKTAFWQGWGFPVHFAALLYNYKHSKIAQKNKGNKTNNDYIPDRMNFFSKCFFVYTVACADNTTQKLWKFNFF